MPFTFIKTVDASAPVTALLHVDQVTIAAGQLLAWDTSGYVSNFSVSAYVGTNAGVAEAGVTGSAVTAGVTTIPVQVNPQAVYLADTEGSAAATDIGINVNVTGAPSNILAEGTAKTNGLGRVKITKLVNTITTSQCVECMINFGSETE